MKNIRKAMIPAWSTRLLGCCSLSLVLFSVTRASEEPAIVALSSKVSSDYVRARLPDGTFETEAYAFGEGGNWGGVTKDASEEKLRFKEVVKTLAPTLYAQNYIPARDPAKTRMVIMVYWGRTGSPVGGSGSSVIYQNAQASQELNMNFVNPASPGHGVAGPHFGLGTAQQNLPDNTLTLLHIANQQRDRMNWENAGILGYQDKMLDVQAPKVSPLSRRWDDLVDEIEDSRYFVVLMAYDFQLLAKQKKHKLLWETRFSIRERGNNFDQQLAAMAQYASRYFGQDSHGLLRKPLPTESIKLNEMKILGEVPGS